MWKPSVNFITLHYTYVIALSFVGFIVIGAYGNVAAIDAYFLGTSAATVTGLSTVNVNNLKTYQQLVLYFIPIAGNMVSINMMVVVARLHLFHRRIRESAPELLRHSRSIPRSPSPDDDVERSASEPRDAPEPSPAVDPEERVNMTEHTRLSEDLETTQVNTGEEHVASENNDDPDQGASREGTMRVAFTGEVKDPPSKSRALYVPPPRERDSGQPIVEVDEGSDHESTREVAKTTDADFATTGLIRQRTRGSTSRTLERVASSIFVPAGPPSWPRKKHRRRIFLADDLGLPHISSRATVGRNSRFHNLTARDREKLGGIEYRSLRLLIKVLVAYFFGLHIIGAICIVAWIIHTDPKYRQILVETAQDKIWWAFFSAQTMTNNLGFTLTPSSMVPFQDAIFPMLFMTFLAFAGNTFYPCGLRFVVWLLFKAVPRESALRETLNYLLRHPRRCYTLLFPSLQTWVLFAILFILNTIDLILFIVLDLKIDAVNKLPGGIRFAAVLFQVASSRHTGTSSFNLADIHPAVQFSLLVMMYISVFPIAMSIRSSNTYEETALGVFSQEEETENKPGRSYFFAHVKNQLAFDLWYIFLGVFCICIAEADRIMDKTEQDFTVFAVFFEAVSAYGNVGLSLGYPTVDASLCGVFGTFSKAVICLLMLRGRHRGMPSRIDRAIMLPGDLVKKDRLPKEDPVDRPRLPGRQLSLSRIRRTHTR